MEAIVVAMHLFEERLKVKKFRLRIVVITDGESECSFSRTEMRDIIVKGIIPRMYAVCCRHAVWMRTPLHGTPAPFLFVGDSGWRFRSRSACYHSNSNSNRRLIVSSCPVVL